MPQPSIKLFMKKRGDASDEPASGEGDQPTPGPLGEPKPKKTRQDITDRKVEYKQYEQQKRSRQFQKMWLVRRDWLRNDKAVGMYCQLCKDYYQEFQHSVSSKGNITFLKGTTNYEVEAVKDHEQSKMHLKAAAVRAAQQLKPGESVAEQTVFVLKKDVMEKLIPLFRNAHAVVKKCHPVKDYVWMAELNEAKGSKIRETYRNEKSCREFIRYIAVDTREEVADHISKAKFFSITCDGATDIASIEQESTCIRFCIKGQCYVQFAGMGAPIQANASGIYDCIMETLGLHLTKEVLENRLVALGSDGASVMLGKNNGVARLLQELQPSLITIHCMAHLLELSCRDAVKYITLYDRVMTLLLGLYLFYKKSYLQCNLLKECFKSFGVKQLLPTRVGGTRWLPHTTVAIDAFLKDAMVPLKKTLLVLEDRATTIADAYAIINSASTVIDSYKPRESPSLKGIVVGPDDVSYKEIPLTSSRTDCASARTRFCKAVIQNRFEDVKEGLLSSTGVANLKSWPSHDRKDEIADFGNDHICQVSHHFEVVLEMNDVDTPNVEPEWDLLKATLYQRYGAKVRELDWSHINSVVGELCPNVLFMSNLILSLPASSSENERLFSQLKQLETERRSRLSEVTLNELLMIQLESPSIKEFNQDRAIRRWSAESSRARRPTFKEKKSTLLRLTPAHYESHVELVPAAAVEVEMTHAESASGKPAGELVETEQELAAGPEEAESHKEAVHGEPEEGPGAGFPDDDSDYEDEEFASESDGELEADLDQRLKRIDF